jgi:hypothetical protein
MLTGGFALCPIKLVKLTPGRGVEKFAKPKVASIFIWLQKTENAPFGQQSLLSLLAETKLLHLSFFIRKCEDNFKIEELRS